VAEARLRPVSETDTKNEPLVFAALAMLVVVAASASLLRMTTRLVSRSPEV
jgi:hypothetical protein